MYSETMQARGFIMNSIIYVIILYKCIYTCYAYSVNNTPEKDDLFDPGILPA